MQRETLDSYIQVTSKEYLVFNIYILSGSFLFDTSTMSEVNEWRTFFNKKHNNDNDFQIEE